MRAKVGSAMFVSTGSSVTERPLSQSGSLSSLAGASSSLGSGRVNQEGSAAAADSAGSSVVA